MVYEYFVSFFTNLFFSILTSYITAKLVLRNYKNKEVFNLQKKIYLKFLNILFLLKKYPHKQFSGEMVSKLEAMQAEFYIHASKKCIKDLSDITDIIRKLCKDFLRNKEPNEAEILDGDIVDAFALQESYDSYIEKNRLNIAQLEELIEKSTKHIRKSLGIR